MCKLVFDINRKLYTIQYNTILLILYENTVCLIAYHACVSAALCNFWTTWEIFMKLCMSIMPLETILLFNFHILIADIFIALIRPNTAIEWVAVLFHVQRLWFQIPSQNGYSESFHCLAQSLHANVKLVPQSMP